MKKKVLFALIALFSFVGAWAADPNPNDVTVGNYTVALDNKLVLIDATTQVATAPTFRDVDFPVTNNAEEVTILKADCAVSDVVYSYNATSKSLAPVENLNQVGNYYLQVTFKETKGQGQEAKTTNKVIYVPFTVGKQIKLWQVYDKLTWDASLKDETSFLSSYYRDYPQFEIWDSEGQQLIRFGNNEQDKQTAQGLLTQFPEQYSHDFRAQLASQANFLDPNDDGAHPFPYLGFTLSDAGKYKVLIRRPTDAGFDVKLWSDNVYGGDQGARTRSFISLATEGSLLANLGIEGGDAYNAQQPYQWGVQIDNRLYVEQGGAQIPNIHFGEAYKYENGQITGEYAANLLEAVNDPTVLNGMELIAVPENQPEALADGVILLTADNTEVTVTPEGETDPISADSKYTYPGVGMNFLVDPAKGNFTVVVTYNGAVLAEGVDYTIQWAEDQNKEVYEDAGTWPINIIGKGTYTTTIQDPQSSSPLQSKITVNYVVEPATMTPKDAKLTTSDVEYAGNETDDRAEEVATISYTDGEGDAAKTVTETVEDYLFYNDETAYTKYVYVGETKPTEGEIIEGTELEYPNHVGFWEMRLYFAPEDGDDNFKADYVSSIFQVTPTQLAMHLGIINWPFGKDYPEINKLYYSIAKSEYAPGDGTNNVRIEGMGQVWPYEQIGSQQSGIPVGSPVGSYKWNLAPGKEALAVTTIGGKDYQNYYVVIHNDNAIINIGKSGLIISVSDDNNSKIYGDEDPDFRPIINNANSDIVFSYTKDKDGKVIAKDANGVAFDLTAPDVIANEDLQAELAEMARIYAGVTVTRKGGKGQTPRLEDVNTETNYKDGYPFSATLSEELKSNYEISKTNGGFFILPYDITPKEAIAATETTPAVPAYTAGRFEITVPNVTYNGTRQTPAVSVIFHHDVLGNIPMYSSAATGDVKKSYSVGEYANNKNVVRDADWKVVAGASVPVTALESDKNIYGTKTGLFTVNPAKLTVGLKSLEKTYGESDPTTLLDCTYSGFVTVGEGDAAKTEDYNVRTDNPDLVGTYYGVWEAPTVTRVKAGTPEGEVVGEYAITATGGKATNYYFDVATAGKLKINKATLTVSATPFKLVEVEGDEVTYERSSDLTYGDHILFDVVATGYQRNPFEAEADANLLGEAEGEDDDIYDPEDKTQDPAYGKITISSQNAGAFTWDFTNENGTPELENYTVVYEGNEGEIAPNKDGLWLTIEPKSKTYGTSDPELTFVATLDGEEVDLEDLLLPEEELDDIVLKRTEGSNAGKYDILFKEAPEQIGNYKVNLDLESGLSAFTINKATLFVKATVVYPQKKDKDGKPVEVDGKPVYETTIPYGEEIGLAYLGQYPGFAIEEYKNHVSNESGMAVIGSGLIAGDDYNKVINESLPFLGDKSVNELVEYTCDYTEEPGVGKFTVSADGPEAKNYIISYNDGVDALEVVAAELALKARNQVINYNDLVEVDAETGNGKYITPAIDDDIDTWVQVIGGPLPAGVEIADLVESISCDETSVGTHDIVITPKESELVTVTNYQNGTLTVNPLDDIHLAYENVAQALEDHKGIQMANVYLPNRQLKPDQWYTFVLPFEFTVPELSNQLYYGVVDILDENKNDGDFHFNLTINGVEANQPFLLKVADNPASPAKDKEGYAVTREEMAQISFAGVTIADVEEDGEFFAYNDLETSPFRADAAGNKITGQYTGVEAGVLTDLDRIMSNGKFGKASKTATLKPTVAYISYPSAAAAEAGRVFVEEANGTTTIIESVDAEGAAETGEGWYTITGIKLEGKPTVKGTYIYNGKKVSIQ